MLFENEDMSHFDDGINENSSQEDILAWARKGRQQMGVQICSMIIRQCYVGKKIASNLCFPEKVEQFRIMEEKYTTLKNFIENDTFLNIPFKETEFIDSDLKATKLELDNFFESMYKPN